MTYNPAAVRARVGQDTCSPGDLMDAMGLKRHYGHQLGKDGRLVYVDDTRKLVDVIASVDRINASADPSRQSTVERHARGRAEATAGPDMPAPVQAPSVAAERGPDVGNSYQQARAVRERFLALEAKRAYEVAMGQLREAREVEALAATAMTELRIRLENLASTLAPMLTGQTDEAKVRALLQDQFAHTLESASHHFARLAAGAKA